MGLPNSPMFFGNKYSKKIILTNYCILFHMSVMILDLLNDNTIPKGICILIPYCCAAAFFVIAGN